nr:hypothetical protein [Nitrosomonas nitrosa]
MDREFVFRDHKIYIREVSQPQNKSHENEKSEPCDYDQKQAHSQRDESHDKHEKDDHSLIELFIDGEKFVLHRLENGVFHTHELPFVVHKSVEDAAKAIVNLRSLGRSHGHTEKPKQAD